MTMDGRHAIASISTEPGRCELVMAVDRGAVVFALAWPRRRASTSTTPGVQSAQLPGTYFEGDSMLTDQLQQKLQAARERFGRPFVQERGSPWKPQPVPFLTRWLAERKKLHS